MFYTDDAPILNDIVELYGYSFVEEMQDYPIWDETKRAWLNERIYDHFRFREIAQDTPGQFFVFLKRRMCEMMPVVNPIFVSLGAENADVDINSSYKTTDMVDNTNTTHNATTDQRDSSQDQLFSNTPQTQLSGGENYATNLTKVTATDSDATTSDTSDTGKTDELHTGRSATVAEQASIWMSNVNSALYIVYNGIEPLFQQVWGD